MFHISPLSKISFNIYNTIIQAKVPYPKKVNALNNKILRTTTRYICQDSGSVLYPQQIGQYIEIG